MPRPHRKCLPNTTYHVYSRCIEIKYLLLDNCLKEILVDVIAASQEKYIFELICYEIMDNHFHFIIKTMNKEATISIIMQYIKARFAERYNKLMNRTGPFWNERFRDTIIDEMENPVQFLLWLLWYIAFNPVRKRKVSDPRDYQYGCIGHYLIKNFKSRLKITYHEYFLNLGKTFKERVNAFLFYEDAYRKRLSVIF